MSHGFLPCLEFLEPFYAAETQKKFWIDCRISDVNVANVILKFSLDIWKIEMNHDAKDACVAFRVKFVHAIFCSIGKVFPTEKVCVLWPKHKKCSLQTARI